MLRKQIVKVNEKKRKKKLKLKSNRRIERTIQWE